MPGGLAIAQEFTQFSTDLPALAASKHLALDELTFTDLRTLMPEWIVAASRPVRG